MEFAFQVYIKDLKKISLDNKSIESCSETQVKLINIIEKYSHCKYSIIVRISIYAGIKNPQSLITKFSDNELKKELECFLLTKELLAKQ